MIRSDNPEENLVIFAPNALDAAYRIRRSMEDLMTALPVVAKYYQLDKQELLESWIKQFGIYYAKGQL